MKEGWEYKKLADVALYSIGLTYKPSDVSEEGTIVLRSSNIQNDKLDLNDIVKVNCPIKESLYVQKDDILMCSRNGSAKLVGKVALIPEIEERMTYGTFMMVIRSVYNPYLFYYFKSDNFRSQIKHGEANMINQITRYMLDDVYLYIPPLSEQQSIVDYLDSAFAKIDAMKANAEKALNEAKALFQASLKEMLEPKEGWEEKKLKEVGRTQTGTTPSKSVTTYYGGEIPFIRPAELDIDGKGGINYNSELKLTSEGALKSRIIRANSTLMCCIGSVGKTGYATQDVTCNQQINTITPYEAYNDRYVYYALLAPSFQNEVIKIANSAKATLAIISKGKWEELSIHFPPLSGQQFIVEVLDSLSSRVSELKVNYDKISQECDALKQAILREVFE